MNTREEKLWRTLLCIHHVPLHKPTGPFLPHRTMYCGGGEWSGMNTCPNSGHCDEGMITEAPEEKPAKDKATATGLSPLKNGRPWLCSPERSSLRPVRRQSREHMPTGDSAQLLS